MAGASGKHSAAWHSAAPWCAKNCAARAASTGRVFTIEDLRLDVPDKATARAALAELSQRVNQMTQQLTAQHGLIVNEKTHTRGDGTTHIDVTIETNTRLPVLAIESEAHVYDFERKKRKREPK